jgi:hypothetical protein
MGVVTPGLALALAIGALMGAFVLAGGFFEGGNDGVCNSTTEFVRAHPEVREFRSEYTVFPPGHRCYAQDAGGAKFASPVFPELHDWGLALLLFFAPLGVWVAARRLRC